MMAIQMVVCVYPQMRQALPCGGTCTAIPRVNSLGGLLKGLRG